MRSLFDNKRLVVIFSILTLGVLVLLSRGLRDIPFREGQSFARSGSSPLPPVPSQIIQSMMNIPIELIVSTWVVVLFIVVLVGFLMTPEWRKRLIRIVIRVGIIYWALYIVFTRYREMIAEMGIDPAALLNAQQTSNAGTQTPPEFASTQTLVIASYIISFGVAVLLIFLAWKAHALWKELSVPSEPPLKKIAQVARSSINDLTAGRESTDVIMNCYYRMSDIVADKRNLERSASMTPGEFAARLGMAGLPADAVGRLTRLFESVRYGSHRSGPGEVREAVESLNAILAYCGESS